jgi:arginase
MSTAPSTRDHGRSDLSFVVVPEWQGSGSARAMRLTDGALAIAGDLPVARTTSVEVPAEAGDALGTPVQRLSAIQEISAAHRAALAAVTGVPITIGGDCGVGLAATAHSIAEGDCAVLWLDAHADLNTPGSSPSGAFHGMVLRTLLGEGPDSLVPTVTLPPSNVVLAGTRSLDPAEDEAIERLGIRMIPPPTDAAAAAVWPQVVADAVAATGAGRVHLHIDVDVHDPADFGAVAFPEPFGVPAGVVLETIRTVLDGHALAGAAITEFSPTSTDEVSGDLAVILRIVGALANRART